MARKGESLRRRIMRDLEKTEREKYRAKIRELRKRAREAKAHRAARLREAKAACNARMKKAIGAANKKFKRRYATDLERQKAATLRRNEERKARVRGARERCDLEDADIRAEAQEKIKLAKAEETEERKFRRDMTRGAKALRAQQRERTRRVPARTRQRERREESDDFAKQNIPTHLHELWEQKKRQFKGKRNLRRDEEFMEWVHENPDEVLHVSSIVSSDDEYAAAQTAYWREQAELEEAGRLEEVPF